VFGRGASEELLLPVRFLDGPCHGDWRAHQRPPACGSGLRRVVVVHNCESDGALRPRRCWSQPCQLRECRAPGTSSVSCEAYRGNPRDRRDSARLGGESAGDGIWMLVASFPVSQERYSGVDPCGRQHPPAPENHSSPHRTLYYVKFPAFLNLTFFSALRRAGTG
jgi:hypothetical protein